MHECCKKCVLLATRIKCTPMCFYLMRTINLASLTVVVINKHTAHLAAAQIDPLENADVVCAVCTLEGSSSLLWLYSRSITLLTVAVLLA